MRVSFATAINVCYRPACPEGGVGVGVGAAAQEQTAGMGPVRRFSRPKKLASLAGSRMVSCAPRRPTRRRLNVVKTMPRRAGRREWQRKCIEPWWVRTRARWDGPEDEGLGARGPSRKTNAVLRTRFPESRCVCDFAAHRLRQTNFRTTRLLRKKRKRSAASWPR
jgi:hypothetical protein